MRTSKLAEAMNYLDDDLLLASETYDNKGGHDVRQAWMKRVGIGLAASVAIVIVIFGAVNLKQDSNLKSDWIALEDVKQIPDVEKVTDLTIASDNDAYSFESVKIASGEMVILNTGAVLEEDEESTFLGHFTGDDICYTVGYICDGAYTEVQNSVTDEDYSGGVSADQAGEVCWCVLNTSSSEVIMDGSIRIAANDLVFRDYGEGFITLNEACTLVIDASAAVLNSSIQSVYLYDYDTKQETEIGNSTKITCKVSEPGVYVIYAVTKDGEVVNLKNYVTIETETGEGSGITTLHFKRN